VHDGTFCDVRPILPPKADIVARGDARFVSQAYIRDFCCNPPHPVIRRLREQQPLRFLGQSIGYRQSVLIDSCSLAQESRIESRIASRGNHPAGGCQTSKNIAVTRDDLVAKLRCISITTTHNMVRQCSAPCGKSLALLEALEHVVCVNRHTAALFL